MSDNPAAVDLYGRMTAMLTPPLRYRKDGQPYKAREAKHAVEDADFAQMVLRMVRALEVRAIANPDVLPLADVVARRAAEVVNCSIAINAQRYAANKFAAPSCREMARTLDISAPSAHQRKQIGERIIGERLAAAGAVDLRAYSEARRDSAAVEAAVESAVVNLADFRARRVA